MNPCAVLGVGNKVPSLLSNILYHTGTRLSRDIFRLFVDVFVQSIQQPGERRTAAGTIFHGAETAVIIIRIAVKQDTGGGLCRDHETAFRQFNAGRACHVAQKGKQRTLLRKRPLGQGTGVHV